MTIENLLIVGLMVVVIRYWFLVYMAHKGVICLGPLESKQQIFVLLDEWVPDSRDLTSDEALAELVWRYFTSHGPATEEDFARWSGLTLTDTRQGLAMVNSKLISTKIEGRTYWAANSATLPAKKTVYLLPGFDEYVIGYQDRSAVLADEHARKVIPGNNGIFQPVMVVEGRVVGTWKRKLKRQSIDFIFHPFESWKALENEIAVAAHTYSDFMGLSVSSIQIIESPVTGPSKEQ